MKLPVVIELPGPPFERVQCQLPKEELDPNSFLWEGYREKRSRGNGWDPNYCMRSARWSLDEVAMCTQHAGMKILELVKVNKP